MAAITTLAGYGLSVCVGSQGDEEIIPGIGDGVLTPGDLVHLGSASEVIGSDEAGVDLMVGIIEVSDITGAEAVIASGRPCEIVIPKSGRRYNVRILDLGGDLEIGAALDISATSGSMDAAGSLNVARAVLAKPYTDNDTVCQIIWL